jgi:hypothetical protein
MKTAPEQLALQHIRAVCQGHADALLEAMQDMQLRALTPDDYTHLNKDDRRLLDQFAYRYTRLQDDMGARLMPAVLKVLGEDISPMSAIDRFTRLEQLVQGLKKLFDDDNFTNLLRAEGLDTLPKYLSERMNALNGVAA